MNKPEKALRKYHSAIYFKQYEPPQKVGCRSLEHEASSPIDARETIISWWRESDVEDRLYPEDIKLVVVYDLASTDLWIFAPQRRVDVVGGIKWERIYGSGLWERTKYIKLD